MKDEKQKSLSGIVTRFKGNGRQLGYPTANLAVDTDWDDGVYFGLANMGDWQLHPSVIFIGIPTTLGDRKRRVEAHLFDIPDEDYYGWELSLIIRHFHRSNQTFESVEDLLIVMKSDEVAARHWFTNHPIE